jgi:hypothetical protein
MAPCAAEVAQPRFIEPGGAKARRIDAMNKTTRRQLLGGMVLVGGAYGLGLATPRIASYVEQAPLRRAIGAILPLQPVPTGLDLGPPIAKLVEAGAMDREKFVAVHENRGPVPEWVLRALDGKSQELVLSIETAPYNLNLLWPLGLATRAAFNEDSPMKGDDLANYASTGGWSLGRGDNGAAYFDAVETLRLTADQSDIVRRLAENVFRPCCGNSAFFQDCNHGSAMLGLMELAAAGRRGPAEILELAKAANGFWYPREYVEIALYFDAVEGRRWRDVPADRVLSAEFSSARGLQYSVRGPLAREGLLPGEPTDRGGSGCAA